MELNYEIIGNRIKEVRFSKKWTQAQLAEKSGVEPSYISHIERAVTKLSLPTLVNIANALEVSLDELLYTNINKSSHISIRMIDDLLSDCTSEEINASAEVIKTIKSILRNQK